LPKPRQSSGTGIFLYLSDHLGPGRSSQAQTARQNGDPQSTTSTTTGLPEDVIWQGGHRFGQITRSGNARHRRDIQLRVEVPPDGSETRSDRPRQSIQSHPATHTDDSAEDLILLRPTPSEELLAAMGPLKERYTTPEAKANKLDLSYISPISMAREKSLGSKRRKEIWQKRQKAAAAMLEPNLIARRSFNKSLPSFLGKYIELVETVLSHDSSGYNSRNMGLVNEKGRVVALPKCSQAKSFLRIFNDNNLAWLSSKGYDITDLTIWEWILTAKSTEQAATRLTLLAKQQSPNITATKPIPTFVLLMLLRRQDFSSRSLRMLLEHAWDRLLHQGRRGATEVSPGSSREGTTKHLFYSEMSEPTIFLMVVRFLRQARKVWPPAIVSISAMMTKYITGIGVCTDTKSRVFIKEKTSARLTFLYNKMLSLLALPSNCSPFRSQIIHQQAQFIVIKRMSEFQPNLIITREGYRGVIAVQLAHKKTTREREWAAMKALSWPPWKEEKLGIDRDIGVEHGISRASEALMRARESGHPLRAWEDVAGVLAGWDTDRSPTIQTRAIIQRGTFIHDVSKENMPPSTLFHQVRELWAARIQATRTVDEAWACFLSFKTLKVSQPAKVVYFAMFEKLILEAKRLKKLNRSKRREPSGAKHNDNVAGSSNLLPGDCKETFPVPGPQDAVYLRKPVPYVNEFLSMMTQDKVKPSGRFLAFLWDHANTFQMGITYLRESSLDFSTIHALLGQNVTPETRRANLELMEDYLFAAFIAFLCRSAPHIHRPKSGPKIGPKIGPKSGSVRNRGKRRLYTVFSYSAVGKLGSTHVNPLQQAFRLMEIRKPHYRPPWNALLSALARPGRVVSSIKTSSQNVHDAMAWPAMCDITKQMREIGLDVDFSGFQILCVGLEKAVIASQRLIYAYKLPLSRADSPNPKNGRHEDKKSRDFHITEAEQVLSTGVLLVRSLFKRLVETEGGPDYSNPFASELVEGPDSLRKIARVPNVLEVPGPAQLHAFIRVLGLCEDYTGMLDLVQWMGSHTLELRAVASEPMNGLNMARRCIIAARVFLERSWLKVDHEDDKQDEQVDYQGVEYGAPPDLVEKVFAVIDENEAWGGWPTDEEVKAYCRKGRFS
ncbi:hypothetical protein MMC07_004468, partial [Pseudocyphellaria aurata]|nr:hypothetical protein [Pseudocyphellaria aurata]